MKGMLIAIKKSDIEDKMTIDKADDFCKGIA